MTGRTATTAVATDPHRLARFAKVIALALGASVLSAVLDSIRLWVAGILAALATLYLTIGGIRYLMANGSPRAMEEGKAAIRSALVGYALAALAPLFVNILRKVLNT